VIPVLTAAQMRKADRAAIDRLGLPGVVLMESAGAAVARVVGERFQRARRVAILCGPGHNGGDGYVIARRLLGLAPAVFAFGARRDEGDAAVHRAIFRRAGGHVVEVGSLAAWRRVRDAVLEADLVVDALLGTGLSSAPRGPMAAAIADLARRRGALVAVDVPSGLDSDQAAAPRRAVRADVTVTLAAPKPALVLDPAALWCGQVVVADIGLPRALLAPTLFVSEAADAAALWPRRAAESHKGRQGHVLVIAGSPGKTGAATLAATAALRAGAGLVTIATPRAALSRPAALRPELMSLPLPEGRRALDKALREAAERDAVVLGPGLGTSGAVQAFVRAFVPRCPAPLIVDADGLNALAAPGQAEALLRRRKAPTVLTPHPGEMARLCALDTRRVQSARLATARRLAEGTGATVVLKGHQTIVAEPSGRAVINPTGNPGLAVAGAGDVLSGAVGALLARKATAFRSALAAVYLHGLAADRIAGSRGEEGILAADVAEALPDAIHALRSGRGRR
jgi:NAD(P)H-hydrate epimerase